MVSQRMRRRVASGTPRKFSSMARRESGQVLSACGGRGIFNDFPVVRQFLDTRRSHLTIVIDEFGGTAGATPGPGGWNRLHFIVDVIRAHVLRQSCTVRPCRLGRKLRPCISHTRAPAAFEK